MGLIAQSALLCEGLETLIATHNKTPKITFIIYLGRHDNDTS